MIPHFPDDPKGRYVNELDEELPDATHNSAPNTSQFTADGIVALVKAGEVTEGGAKSPSKRGSGEWRSVKSLEAFWEMMAFRSECSSGRLVGFLWVVVETLAVEKENEASFESQESGVTVESNESQVSTVSSFSQQDEDMPLAPPRKQHKPKSSAKARRTKLTGPIVSRLPRIKSDTSSLSTESLPPALSAYYTWPASSRGTLLLSKKSYDKANEILRRTDFETVKLGAGGTRAWIEEVGLLGGAGGSGWGISVVGKKEPDPAAVESNGVGGGKEVKAMNVLSVKRKKAGEPVVEGEADAKKLKADTPAATESALAPQVNTLGASMIRKKPKKVQPTQIV
jgi:regulator of Ty1 transposition protein 109